jgi:formate dehydrogenase maturation protein FdhE
VNALTSGEQELMTKPTATPDDLFKSEIENIAPFIDALAGLWEQFNTLDIFGNRPELPTLENARETLRCGEPLCAVLPSPQSAPSQKLLLDILKLYEQFLPDRAGPVVTLRQEFELDEELSGKFISDLLANDARAIIQFALQRQIPEDLISLLGVHAGRPWRAYCARSLPSELEFKTWQRGECPVCGHRPALAHIDSAEGHRTLWCMHCGTSWPHQRIQCAFCGTREQDNLEILHPEQTERYRVQTCSECKRFLKEIRSDQGVDDYPFDQAYLGTGLLDQMAWEEGYIQDSVLLVPEVKPQATVTDD